MRFAYADPPYLGRAVQLYGEQAAEYDTLEGHARLIERLGEYDGWALSMGSNNLHALLPLCPPDVRVMAWVKPFASFKPNVNPAYAWEPVVMRGSRKIGRDEPTVRDYCAVNITLKKGLVGAKPPEFCRWLFTAAGLRLGDEFVDLFPGTGGVSEAWRAWCGQAELTPA